jgi:hypothetical protein
MDEVKAFFITVVIVCLVIIGTVYLFNAADWSAQTERRNTCIAQGGIYLNTPQMEGCIVLGSIQKGNSK